MNTVANLGVNFHLPRVLDSSDQASLFNPVVNISYVFVMVSF